METTDIILAATPLVLLLVEYYLGQSEVPKANSIIQLIINFVKILTGGSKQA